MDSMFLGVEYSLVVMVVGCSFSLPIPYWLSEASRKEGECKRVDYILLRCGVNYLELKWNSRKFGGFLFCFLKYVWGLGFFWDRSCCVTLAVLNPLDSTSRVQGWKPCAMKPQPPESKRVRQLTLRVWGYEHQDYVFLLKATAWLGLCVKRAAIMFDLSCGPVICTEGSWVSARCRTPVGSGRNWKSWAGIWLPVPGRVEGSTKGSLPRWHWHEGSSKRQDSSQPEAWAQR